MVKLFRIYLDTCVLVSAILESDPAWQQIHQKEAKIKNEEIQASKTILSTKICELKTSTYALGEFISMGRAKKFGKTLQEMFNLMSGEIFPRCDILSSNLAFQDIPKLDEKWGKIWTFAEINCTVNIKDVRSGEYLGSRNISCSLSKDLVCMHTKDGRENFGDFEIEKFNSLEYPAPAFEIMLFTKASEIAIRCNIHLTDALHILYAQGNTDIILTNDEEFYKKWANNPQLKQETGVYVKSTIEFVRWCQKHNIKL